MQKYPVQWRLFWLYRMEKWKQYARRYQRYYRSGRLVFLGFISENHKDLINPKRKLALLANEIDWDYFENEFKSLYSDKPIRPPPNARMMYGWIPDTQIFIQFWR
jgi:hypothetical protein